MYVVNTRIVFSRKYFRLVCDVDDPEVRFNMDQYTDVTRVTKPVIYISIQEMIDTHKLLLEHENAIAPDVADRLHELLEDVGEVPAVEDLLGKNLSSPLTYFFVELFHHSIVRLCTHRHTWYDDRTVFMYFLVSLHFVLI